MTEFKTRYAFWRFQNEIRDKRRHFLSQESQDFLRTVAATSASRMTPTAQGYRGWRAQVGVEWEGDNEEFECPLPQERMIPLADRAFEGRVNPKGIPCLYIATTPEAAMSEVRPWIGSYVSVALLETTRDLFILDCSKYHAAELEIHFEEPAPHILERILWTQIDKAFSQPVTRSDDTADYAVTQILAELFKSQGADGIAYKSLFGDDGYNIALFNLTDARIIERHIYKTIKANFDFQRRGRDA